MKISDICNLYSENHKFTEEYIYKNNGIYPVYSATLNKPYGWCDSYQYDFPILIVVNYGDAGKTRIVDGKFNIGRNISGLTIKDKFKSIITLDYLNLILSAILLSMREKGNMGCISQQTLKNVELPYPFPPIEEQNAIVEQYEKLEKMKDNVEAMLSEITEILNSTPTNRFHTEQSSIKVKDIFNIYGGNQGLYEEIIYRNRPNTKENAVTIVSSALTAENQMNEIDVNAKIKNKPLKFFNEDIIVIARKGNPGVTRFFKKSLIAITETAYVMTVKKDWKEKINLKWFNLVAYQYTSKAISSEDNNGTFSKDLFENQTIKNIPSVEEQNAIVEQYEKLEKMKANLSNVLYTINKIL